MNEIGGAIAAILSSASGGTAVAATRYLASRADPFLIGTLRFGIGFLILFPLALMAGGRWPSRRDLPATVGLGLLFFAAFPILFNAGLSFTTAARGAIGISTIPLQTMLIAAALRIESLTPRKTLGVLIATAGVAVALVAGLSTAPEGAWRGDLLMLGAACLMSVASIASRGVLSRSSSLTFTSLAMLVGTTALVAIGLLRGSFAALANFDRTAWLSGIYLGIVGGAVAFFLWSLALRSAPPTMVGIAVTVTPITASVVGALLLGEPASWNLVIGLLAVFAGVWLTVTPPGGLRMRRGSP